MKLFFMVRLALVVLCCSLLLTGLGTGAGAIANYPDWLSRDPAVRLAREVTTPEAAFQSTRHCTDQVVQVRDYDPTSACVVQMKGWRYALYTHWYWQWGMRTSETLFVVGIGSDTQMYAVEGVPTTYPPLENPGTDTLVYFQANAGLLLYPHFRESLERTEGGYRVAADATKSVNYQEGSPVIAGAAAVSPGGGWLVASTGNGVTRTDMQTGDTRLVSPLAPDPRAGYNATMDVGVSDDGQSVAVGGRMYGNPQFRVITVNDDCGTPLPGNASDQNACPYRDFEPLVQSGAIPAGWPVSLRFSQHGRRLDAFLDRLDGYYQPVSLYASGAVPPTVRYMALGDSFSSGEGDPGSDSGQTPYYLPHTDVAGGPGVPREMCHLSRRSYPFDLMAQADTSIFTPVPDHPVESVACNNAHIGDIISDNPNGYLGQDGRLAGLSTAPLDDLRTEALDQFVPGRLRQADFVDAYQPQALTLGVGGNDVQFAGIIRACATSLVTCSYASDPTDRRNVGESIKSLYPRLLETYMRLTRLDPGAKVYVVGYPRFVNETNPTCPATVNLDYAERQMVDQGVRYLNGVMKAAALSAGVEYVDIEDSLLGHRLCDDGPAYVNGIDFADVFAQEGFHPNASAHAAIARAIERQVGTSDLAGGTYCSTVYPCPVATEPPGLPTFFGDGSVRPTSIAVPTELLLLSGSPIPYWIEKGAEFTVQTALLAAGSTARISLHSTATDLGTPTVTVDGTLTIKLTIPDSVPDGFHTLHIYGMSPSGEAVDLYQIVYVGMKESAAPPAAPGTNGAQNSGATTSGSPRSEAEASGKNVVSDAIRTLPVTIGHYWPYLVPAGLIVGAALCFWLARALLRRPR